MTDSITRFLSLSPCLVVLAALSTLSSAEVVLFDFGGGFDVASLPKRSVEADLSATGNDSALKISKGKGNYQWPGVTLNAPEGNWDLSAFEHVAVDVKNIGAEPVTVHCRIDDAESNASKSWLDGRVTVEAGQQEVLIVALRQKMPKEYQSKLFGMRGYPGGWQEGRGIDLSKAVAVMVFVSQPETDYAYEIDNIRAAGVRVAALPDAAELFPMIDRFGQYIHSDWPGKTQSVDDLERCKQEEAADLAAHAGPEGWDQYGGWASGPKLEATGFFRAEKYRGMWWLVDPDGRLFWSHGIDCVRPSGYTPIANREHWFEELPEAGSPFAAFLGHSSWDPRGLYQGKRYQIYNFTSANLLRKYGPDWYEQYTAISHRRLRSWGLNTVGNWSDTEIYLARKTPYVVAISVSQKPIEGSSGYWHKFPDPFDADFKEKLSRRMAAEKGRSAGDPWCIGYFVNNELSWGDELSLAVATLASPPEQAAKQVFVEDLKQRYQSIDKLNQAWGIGHASWDALLESHLTPDKSKARADLLAFNDKTARRYFQGCREAVKAVAPENLYLGCRFAWSNDQAVRAASGYCDVIGFNRYRPGVEDFSLPEGVDRPVVIGEFHFGALDRGMFHTGLQPVADQAARAEAYKSYVTGALRNPCLVGTHWFQFGDQATTGRGDGENYQIGFLDICDTPYTETVQAAREVGAAMYRIRLARDY